MFLGRVVDTVVATEKHVSLRSHRLLWVERTDPEGRPLGRRVVALDTVDAGMGDLVLVLDEGNGAAQVLRRRRGPIRTVIVGVVTVAAGRARRA